MPPLRLPFRDPNIYLSMPDQNDLRHELGLKTCCTFVVQVPFVVHEDHCSKIVVEELEICSMIHSDEEEEQMHRKTSSFFEKVRVCLVEACHHMYQDCMIVMHSVNHYSLQALIQPFFRD